jgi:ribosomal protein L40E
MNNKNKVIKIILRIVGFSLLIIGLVLTIIGFVNFGNFESNLFMLTFIGLPCIAFGIGITVFSFSQNIARFIKNEHVSVMNEFAEDINPAIKSFASAVNEGLNEQEFKLCACGNKNPTDAQFCNKCGAKLD